MGKRDHDVVRDASEQVFALFRDAVRDGGLVYHSYDRSRELARTCREIAKGCDLDDEQTRVVLLAAWFNDAGYATAPGADGTASAAVARRYLAGSGERPELADAVEACMRAVRSDVLENAAQEVLHDALLVPAAGKSYLRELPLLRLERERRAGTPLSDIEWTEQSIRYLEEHPFRTRYAQLEYNRGRAENLVRLHDLLREQRDEAAERLEEGVKAVKGLGKTIEGVYSQMNKDLLQLLGIADRRTNTMVHVNAIMISLIAALLLRNIESHRQLLVPTLLLLAVNLIVVVISILSLRVPRTHESVLGSEGKGH